MTVGAQASQSTVDQKLTDLALSLRDTYQQVENLFNWIAAEGGVTFLESLGYAPADATSANNLIGFMNNLAAIYQGKATQPTASNFEAAFAVLWAGQ